MLDSGNVSFYHVPHAEEYSKESIGFTMDMPIRDRGDYVKKELIFTSMRSQDCYTLRTKGFTFVPANKNTHICIRVSF